MKIIILANVESVRGGRMETSEEEITFSDEHVYFDEIEMTVGEKTYRLSLSEFLPIVSMFGKSRQKEKDKD